MEERDRELRWLGVGELLKELPFPSRKGDSSPGPLLSSVRLHGVLSPLLVRPAGDHFQVVCGYRRLLAARDAGLDQVPVMVLPLEDVEAIRCYLSENTCRREMTDASWKDTVTLLKHIREGSGLPDVPDVPDDEASAEATEPVEGELWTPGLRGVGMSRPRGTRAPVERWDIDRQVEEAAAAATVVDLIERIDVLLGSVRNTKRIDMELARGVVRDLLGLSEAFRPLQPAQAYAEERESWLAQHCLLAASLNASLAPDGVTELGREGYALAGLLHDIGMAFLDCATLNEARHLDARRKREIQSHTRLGHAMILDQGKDYAEIALVARDHHERLEGSGYPNGLRGDELGRLVRATSLVDAFASLTGSRPHRERLAPDAALGRLAQATEKGLFDPQLFPLLHAAVAQGEAVAQREAVTTSLATEGASFARWGAESRKTQLTVEFY